MPYRPPNAGQKYVGISAPEAATAWTLEPGEVTGSAGRWTINVTHFSLWAATSVPTGEVPGSAGPIFAGLTSATTNTTEGGVDFVFESPTARATQPTST